MIDLSSIKLIPADESHREFYSTVKKEAYGEYITRVWGWDEQKERDFQAKDWQEKRPAIITYGGKPIGTIYVKKDENYIEIGQFYILPEYQKQGIGSHVLKAILDNADRTGRIVKLMYLGINPAASLYARMGFKVAGTEEPFIMAERKPNIIAKNDRKYQAVIFDLYGTLVENYPSSEGNRVLKQAAAIFSAPPEEFMALWYKDFDDRQIGILKTYQECFKHICQRLGVKYNQEQLDSTAELRYKLTRQEAMTYKEGALEALIYLRAKKYKIGLVSNCSLETTRIWPETKLAPLIDVPVFSAVEGIKKPDPRLFQIALDRLGVLAAECLYIADGMSQELTTASKLGMQAILVKVPHNSEYEDNREEWNGATISSLKEVPGLLG
jgi:putative hydrolase of the HAD superfamily